MIDCVGMSTQTADLKTPVTAKYRETYLAALCELESMSQTFVYM